MYPAFKIALPHVIDYVVCNHNLRSAYFDPESRKIFQNLLISDLFPSTTKYVSRNKKGHLYLSEFSPQCLQTLTTVTRVPIQTD